MLSLNDTSAWRTSWNSRRTIQPIHPEAILDLLWTNIFRLNKIDIFFIFIFFFNKKAHEKYDRSSHQFFETSQLLVQTHLYNRSLPSLSAPYTHFLCTMYFTGGEGVYNIFFFYIPFLHSSKRPFPCKIIIIAGTLYYSSVSVRPVHIFLFF